MESLTTRPLWGASSLWFALALSGAALAQSSNSQPSSAAERAQTEQLNQGISDANNSADAQIDRNNAQYQAQQQVYQEQLQQYRTRVTNYEEKAGRYEAARDRYTAAQARYHRAVWPSRYEHSLIVDTHDLLGAQVHTSAGLAIGHVEEIALSSGHVDALRIMLDLGRGDVWIESADLRFDPESKVVITNLDRQDLYEMTHESF